ncbi:MAG: asparaginase [Proteobacteria bacterium]|nr:asparaginase [Pseudomonadota bacterium]
MFIRFITTGGTIDKIYFDELSQFEVGESQVRHVLTEALVGFDDDVVPMMQKDSLELTDADRQQLHDFVANDDAERYVITHGTDTMPQTADTLADLTDKTIVLTGALSPARFRSTDAVFNVGTAGSPDLPGRNGSLRCALFPARKIPPAGLTKIGGRLGYGGSSSLVEFGRS